MIYVKYENMKSWHIVGKSGTTFVDALCPLMFHRSSDNIMFNTSVPEGEHECGHCKRKAAKKGRDER